MRQLKRSLQPALTDISVDWGSLLPKAVAPFRLPLLFSGGRLIFYVFLDGKANEGIEFQCMFQLIN